MNAPRTNMRSGEDDASAGVASETSATADDVNAGGASVTVGASAGVASGASAAANTGAGAASPGSARKKAGRRPGGPDTRQVILDSARAEFAARGYENTSMRAIARSAEVNSALLHHYFGTKEQLFLAALDFPIRPRDLVAQVLGGDREQVGERLVRFAFGMLENPASRERVLAVLRAAATNEEMARLLRGFIERELVAAVATALDVPNPRLRAELAMTQIVGVIMGRYVLAAEPLASAPVDELVPLLAPTLQRYLVG
jgi:AcrR family transcriptional regulator